jgi:adenylylsulfate kinase
MRATLTPMADVPTVLISGTIGSGKTAVAAELGHLLEERGVPCALIDLDWLCWLHPSPDPNRLDELMAQNLAAILPNFLAAGARAFVLTRAVERQSTLKALREALPHASLTVVRLVASQSLIEQRLRRRDTGKELEEHLRQSQRFAAAMEEAKLEDATVMNDGRSIRAVAEGVLRAWPSLANPRLVKPS